jgi:hypothetical protein
MVRMTCKICRTDSLQRNVRIKFIRHLQAQETVSNQTKAACNPGIGISACNSISYNTPCLVGNSVFILLAEDLINILSYLLSVLLTITFLLSISKLCLVGKSLRKFLTALELPKKIIEETLTDCAITALKCSRKIFLSLIIQFRTIMLIKGHGPDYANKRRLFETKLFFFQIKSTHLSIVKCIANCGICIYSKLYIIYMYICEYRQPLGISCEHVMTQVENKLQHYLVGCSKI